MNKKIIIGCDHAGFELKEKLKNDLLKTEYVIEDVGTHSIESVDYPDFGHLVAKKVIEDKNNIGVVICGSGNGINMTVNKYKEIRSALCWDKEITKMARLHNDANILALPARFMTYELALDCLEIFINTPFEKGRHLKRINKI